MNGQWIKGAGGVPVWAAITPADVAGITHNTTSGVVVSAANTDLAWPGGAAPTSLITVWTGGGSLRTLGAPTLDAAQVTILNWSGVQLLIVQAGSGTGKPIYLRDVANLVLGPNEAVDLVYDASSATWNETSRDVGVSYGTTLPASPYNGQEAIIVDSTTNPTLPVAVPLQRRLDVAVQVGTGRRDTGHRRRHRVAQRVTGRLVGRLPAAEHGRTPCW